MQLVGKVINTPYLSMRADAVRYVTISGFSSTSVLQAGEYNRHLIYNFCSAVSQASDLVSLLESYNSRS